MVAAAKERSHGQTGAAEIALDQSKDLEKAEGDKPDSSFEPLNLTRAFQRMRTDWQGPDRDTINRVKRIVEEEIHDTFKSAYLILFDIHSIVREPVVDPITQEIAVHADGFPKWQENSDGSIREDWSRLTTRERESLLYKINIGLFEWEQLAATIRGEALFAKAQWEEAFANGFDSIPDPKMTVDARTARGNKLAADHRYLAVYKSMYSKKADAIVSSMERISQRIKDISMIY